MEGASKLVQTGNSTLEKINWGVDKVQEEVDMYNMYRVNLSYFFFAVTIFASVMTIFGVVSTLPFFVGLRQRQHDLMPTLFCAQWFVVPFLYRTFTGVLLIMLVVFFVLFIPYGTVTVISSDS